MKLLHVIAQIDPKMGGVGEAVRTTVKQLDDLGVYNEVVSLDEPDAPFLLGLGIKIHALGPGKRPWCYSKNLTPWLVAHGNKFDAIVLHGLWLYPGFAVKKALLHLCQKRSVGPLKVPKFFIMPHGMLDPYFQRASGRRLKAIRNWLYWKLIERKVVQKAEALLFTCEEELYLARTTFRPYRPQKEVNVGLGVASPPPFNEKMRRCFLEKCPGLHDSSYILFVGRIHPKKGVDILVEAYCELLQKAYQSIKERRGEDGVGTSSEVKIHDFAFPKLVIAGPGLETSYGKTVKKISEESALLTNFICFPGMLNGDAKWGAFYGCEAFVLPSHQENFGIAVVEALACRKPVLITNRVNIWREIEADSGGLVAADNKRNVYELIDKWIQLPHDARKKMEQNAGATYDKHFAVEHVVKRFLNAIS